jgi:hypothetical protein
MRTPDRDKIEFAIIALTIIAAALISLARL